jgi:PAS domain-containing protein
MSDHKPNTELAYRVLDHIDAHPELWKQDVYIGRSDCGTVACFAGWACLLSGDEPHVDLYYVKTPAGVRVYASDRAEELLGIPSEERLVERTEATDEPMDDLFAAGNTREKLGEMVEKIFGPRPSAENKHTEDK